MHADFGMSLPMIRHTEFSPVLTENLIRAGMSSEIG
jgi:hypothetical protein